MATFIALVRYTERGIGNIKDGPARFDAARKSFEKLGVTIEEF